VLTAAAGQALEQRFMLATPLLEAVFGSNDLYVGTKMLVHFWNKKLHAEQATSWHSSLDGAAAGGPLAMHMWRRG
jgi:hypothetical protein